jgi:hypothetical protein
MTTDKDFTKLATEALERAEKATGGPWSSYERETSHGHHRVLVGPPGANEARTALTWFMPDAVFIAHARTDVPTLAYAVLELVGDARTADNFSQDRIDALQAENERLRAVIRSYEQTFQISPSALKEDQ